MLRDDARKDKAQLELKLAKDVGDNKNVYCYISFKRINKCGPAAEWGG